MADDGAPHGTVVAAGYQSAGLTRKPEHTWQAPRGSSLLFTLIVREGTPPSPPPPPAGGTPLSPDTTAPLRVGNGVRRYLEEHCRISAQIRWPNDILVNNKKICGILCRLHAAPPDGESYLLVGVGLNCRQRHFPARNVLATPATSIRREHRSRSRSHQPRRPIARLPVLVQCIHEELSNPKWRAYTRGCLWHRGRVAQVTDPAPPTGAAYPARIIDVADDGALIIETENAARRRVYSATLRVPHS